MTVSCVSADIYAEMRSKQKQTTLCWRLIILLCIVYYWKRIKFLSFC